jgi:hypothetical protein
MVLVVTLLTLFRLYPGREADLYESRKHECNQSIQFIYKAIFTEVVILVYSWGSYIHVKITEQVRKERHDHLNVTSCLSHQCTVESDVYKHIDFMYVMLFNVVLTIV